MKNSFAQKRLFLATSLSGVVLSIIACGSGTATDPMTSDKAGFNNISNQISWEQGWKDNTEDSVAFYVEYCESIGGCVDAPSSQAASSAVDPGSSSSASDPSSSSVVVGPGSSSNIVNPSSSGGVLPSSNTVTNPSSSTVIQPSSSSIVLPSSSGGGTSVTVPNQNSPTKDTLNPGTYSLTLDPACTGKTIGLNGGSVQCNATLDGVNKTDWYVPFTISGTTATLVLTTRCAINCY